MGFFEKLKNGLFKSRNSFFGKIKSLFTRGIDEDTLEELEEMLICADVGYEVTEEILDQLRRYLPEDIGIHSCKDASPRFHARLNAKEKTYLYRIWNSEKPCVFDRRYVAVMPETLELDAMRRAAEFLCGEHDFSAFCGNAKIKKSTVRFIRSIEIERHGEEVRLYFTGNGFLHNMVRILTGTLVEVGRGERIAESVPELFGNKRAEAGFLAPAKGLCLEEVMY